MEFVKRVGERRIRARQTGKSEGKSGDREKRERERVECWFHLERLSA